MSQAEPGSRPSGEGAGCLREVLEFLRSSRGFDAAGYSLDVLGQRVDGRLRATGTASCRDYVDLLRSSAGEVGLLQSALTVKVSSFFRDPFAFEYLNEFVLPALLARKAAEGDHAVRVWSAGCAGGEEAYSVAVLLHELVRRESPPVEAMVFATDVDEQALAFGREALYPAAALANVRRGLLASAFRREGDSYRVVPEVARTVRFSAHDLLDRRSAAPADSIFGTFDLVLCRNVLIYFDAPAQDAVAGKLWNALADGGHLLLGRTEGLPDPWRPRLRRVLACASLFQKPAAAPARREPR